MSLCVICLRPMNLKHPAATIVVVLLVVCLLVGSLAANSSSAQRAVVQEPASEGRSITPAGTLVQDITTRQAAVGALPVDFVRSPDKLGPDGAGRYLIAVNSGYGRSVQRFGQSWSAIARRDRSQCQTCRGDPERLFPVSAKRERACESI